MPQKSVQGNEITLGKGGVHQCTPRRVPSAGVSIDRPQDTLGALKREREQSKFWSSLKRWAFVPEGRPPFTRSEVRGAGSESGPVV